MANYEAEVDMVTIECGGCGTIFGMSKKLYKQRHNDHNNFWCPRGCCRHFTAKSEAQKLQEQLDRTQSKLESELGRSSMLASQNQELSKSYSKMRDRIKNGVCPCRKRTFQNLLDHMKSEHPDFGNDKALKGLRDLFGLTQAAVAKEIGVSASHVSLYEREKPVPEYAETAIEHWIARSAG